MTVPADTSLSIYAEDMRYNPGGEPIAHATFTVFNAATGNAADIYTLDNDGVAVPISGSHINTDLNGRLQFVALPGFYQVRLSGDLEFRDIVVPAIRGGSGGAPTPGLVSVATTADLTGDGSTGHPLQFSQQTEARLQAISDAASQRTELDAHTRHQLNELLSGFTEVIPPATEAPFVAGDIKPTFRIIDSESFQNDRTAVYSQNAVALPHRAQPLIRGTYVIVFDNLQPGTIYRLKITDVDGDVAHIYDSDLNWSPSTGNGTFYHVGPSDDSFTYVPLTRNWTLDLVKITRQVELQMTSKIRLAVRSVGAAELKDLSISTGKIVDRAITNRKLNDGSVSETKLDAAVRGKLNDTPAAANDVTAIDIIDGELVLTRADGSTLETELPPTTVSENPTAFGAWHEVEANSVGGFPLPPTFVIAIVTSVVDTQGESVSIPLIPADLPAGVKRGGSAGRAGAFSIRIESNRVLMSEPNLAIGRVFYAESTEVIAPENPTGHTEHYTPPEIIQELEDNLMFIPSDHENRYSKVEPNRWAPNVLSMIGAAGWGERLGNSTPGHATQIAQGNAYPFLTPITRFGFNAVQIYEYTDDNIGDNQILPGAKSYFGVNAGMRNNPIGAAAFTPSNRWWGYMELSFSALQPADLLKSGTHQPVFNIYDTGHSRINFETGERSDSHVVGVKLGGRDGSEVPRTRPVPLTVLGGNQLVGSGGAAGNHGEIEFLVPTDLPVNTGVKINVQLEVGNVDVGTHIENFVIPNVANDVAEVRRDFTWQVAGGASRRTFAIRYQASNRRIFVETVNPGLLNADYRFTFSANFNRTTVEVLPRTFAQAGIPDFNYTYGGVNKVLFILQPHDPTDTSNDPFMQLLIIVNNHAHTYELHRPMSDIGDLVADGILFGSNVTPHHKNLIGTFTGRITTQRALELYAQRDSYFKLWKFTHPADTFSFSTQLTALDADGNAVALSAGGGPQSGVESLAGGGWTEYDVDADLLNVIGAVSAAIHVVPETWDDIMILYNRFGTNHLSVFYGVRDSPLPTAVVDATGGGAIYYTSTLRLVLSYSIRRILYRT